jgi:hypothetical protein
MSGINYTTQHVTQLGQFKMETGYIATGDITKATGLSVASVGATHSVPTTLTHVAAGWMICSSTSGGVHGCITAPGSVCTAHASGGSCIDFTMDTTCTGGAITSGSGDFYLIFGW